MVFASSLSGLQLNHNGQMGRVVTEGGTVGIKGQLDYSVYDNQYGKLTNITFFGANNFMLDAASTMTSSNQNYLFDAGLGASNYVGLILKNASTYQGGWKQAAELKDFTLADLMVPTQEGNETEGRIMRVGDRLVIGLVCKQPGGIWAETKPETFAGSAIYRESCSEIFFGPVATGASQHEFALYVVNSLGAFRGFAKAADNRKDVQCAVKMAADGKSYTVEAALPLKVDGQYDYAGARMLTFNIQRSPFHGNTFNPKERIGWAPIFFTAGFPESRGLLIME